MVSVDAVQLSPAREVQPYVMRSMNDALIKIKFPELKALFYAVSPTGAWVNASVSDAENAMKGYKHFHMVRPGNIVGGGEAVYLNEV